MLDDRQISSLPLRMTRDEACAFARFSPATLARKRAADPGWLPASPVQGGRQTIFDRDAVLKALGVPSADAPALAAQPVTDIEALDAFRRARLKEALRRGGRNSAAKRKAEKQAAP